MNKFFNIYIASIVSIIYSLFAFISLASRYDIVLIISFICVIISNFLLMTILFSSKYGYFDAVMSIFYALFFIIAPILQLNKGIYPVPINVNEDYIIMANICNCIFMLIYIFFRHIDFKNKDKKSIIIKDFNMSKSTMLFMSLMFFIKFIPKLPQIISEILMGTTLLELDKTSGLIMNKFILFIPLLFVFYYINEYKKDKSKKKLVVLLFWLIILLVCKNPFNEKRNALGPIYLAIIFFLTIKKNNLKVFVITATAIFIVGFPLTSIITHSNIGLVDIINNFSSYINYDLIISQFYELHFDAFANITVAIDYTKNFGVSFGMQLLGAFLFFIPRSIWIGKPLNSGIITGNYLINYYGFHFNNLSSPITAEAYYNGGIIAVIVFAIIISKWSRLTYRWLSYKNYYTLIAWYMVIHLFFLMRGDLMNGIAYLIGPLSAIYFIPLAINTIELSLNKVKANGYKVLDT